MSGVLLAIVESRVRVSPRQRSLEVAPRSDASVREDLVAALHSARQQGAWLLVLRAALDYAALVPNVGDEVDAALRDALGNCADSFDRLDIPHAQAWLLAHEKASQDP